MDYCASLEGRSALDEPWVTNGELIAGLENPETTKRAITRVAMAGAIPTVCVFRPLKGTKFEYLAPPKWEQMVGVFAHLYETCMEYNLPIGVVPNVHVSLVMLPEECALLSPLHDSRSHRWKNWKLKLKRFAVGAMFNERMYQLDHRVGISPLGFPTNQMK